MPHYNRNSPISPSITEMTARNISSHLLTKNIASWNSPTVSLSLNLHICLCVCPWDYPLKVLLNFVQMITPIYLGGPVSPTRPKTQASSGTKPNLTAPGINQFSQDYRSIVTKSNATNGRIIKQIPSITPYQLAMSALCLYGTHWLKSCW